MQNSGIRPDDAQLVCAAVVGKNQIVLGAYPVNLSYHNNPPMGAASSREIK